VDCSLVEPGHSISGKSDFFENESSYWAVVAESGSVLNPEIHVRLAMAATSTASCKRAGRLDPRYEADCPYPTDPGAPPARAPNTISVVQATSIEV
jgi:hypothetical protein